MRHGGIFVALALSLAPRPGAAEQQDFGTGGSATWALAAGTRALALGNAAGLLANDATVLAHNPASLSMIGNGEAGFHHGVWDAGVSWDQVAAVLPLSAYDAIGVSGAMASYGSMDKTDDTGVRSGTYEASEALTALGYSHRFGELALGGSGFMTRQTIDKDILFSYAWAGGLVWQPQASLTLAASLRSATEGFAQGNLEGDFGAAVHSQGDHGHAWSLAVDSYYAGESTSDLQIAGTRGFRSGDVDGQILGGYKITFASGLDQGTVGSWSLGASLGWQAWAFDYAFTPMGDLESSHHLGLRYRFSEPARDPIAAAPVVIAAPPPVIAPTPLPTPAQPEPVALTITVDVPGVPLPATQVLVLSDDVAKGQALEGQGQARAALKAYAAAVVADPGDLPAWKSMAKLYDRLNRPDLGLRCWREVARLDPADLQAAAAIRLGEISGTPLQ